MTPHNRWWARIEAVANLLASGSITVNTTTGGSTPITPNHTFADVNGNTAIIAANANRKYLLIVNDSDTIIYINLGGAGVVNQGIRINAGGGSYEMSAGCGNLYTGAINANHGGGAANKRVLLTEGV